MVEASDEMPTGAAKISSSRLIFVLVGTILSLSCSKTVSTKNLKLSAARLQLGTDYLRRRNPEMAKAELLKSVAADPSNSEAHYLIGVIYFLEGVHAEDYAERSQCLKGGAKAEQLATARRALLRAQRHLLRVVELGKSRDRIESDALNYLSNIAIHFKKFAEAIALSNEALKNTVYVHRHILLSNRGWAKFLDWSESKQGQIKAAGRDLRQALFHRPAFCLARFRLAKVYFAQKQFDMAITELERITSDNTCPIQESQELAGLAYLRMGRIPKARQHFLRCVDRNPRSCVALECRRYAKVI